MSRLGAVAGLAAEAEVLRRAAAAHPQERHPLIFCAGGSARRARQGAAALVASGAVGLVSFGIAGGLSAELAAGDLVLAAEVVAPDGRRHSTDAAWRARLRARLGPIAVREGVAVGSDRVARTPADKLALAAATGAVIVDMESHGVARAAEAAGLPFLVLRVVADPLTATVPWSALAGVGPGGERRVWPVLMRLARRPADLPALLRLRRESRAALATLGRVAAVDPLALALL